MHRITPPETRRSLCYLFRRQCFLSCSFLRFLFLFFFVLLSAVGQFFRFFETRVTGGNLYMFILLFLCSLRRNYLFSCQIQMWLNKYIFPSIFRINGAEPGKSKKKNILKFETIFFFDQSKQLKNNKTS